MAANERDGDFGTSSFFGQLSAHAKSSPYTSTIGVSRIKNIRVTRLRVEVAVWFFCLARLTGLTRRNTPRS